MFTNPKIRRNGVELRAAGGVGPDKKEVYLRTDADGFCVEIRAIEFPDDGQGEGSWIEVENQIPKVNGSPPASAPNKVRMLQHPVALPQRARPDLLVEAPDGLANGFEDIPLLVKELQCSGFNPAQSKWPHVFDRLLKILEPEVYRALRPYCRERLRFRMTKEMWRLVCGEVWKLATLHPPKAIAARKFWSEQLGARVARLLVPRISPEETGRESAWETDPKSPTEWLSDNLRYSHEIDRLCNQFGVFGTERACIHARADEVFSGYYFGVVKLCSAFQLARQGEPWPIAEFERAVFFPAIREALRIIFPRREATGSPVVISSEAKELGVRFVEVLKKGVRERFNGLRSQRRAREIISGNEHRGFGGYSQNLEVEDSGHGEELFDRYVEAPSDFVEEPSLQEIKLLCKEMPRSGRAFREFDKIRNSLPSYLGVRAAKTEAYRRLSLRFGMRESALRKQICLARRYLRMLRISPKMAISDEALSSSAGNELAYVSGRPSGIQRCSNQETNRRVKESQDSAIPSVQVRLVDEHHRTPDPGGAARKDRTTSRRCPPKKGIGGGLGGGRRPSPQDSR